MLGKWPLTKSARKSHATPHIALTKDEKNKIMGKKSAEDVLREQRDQALIEIGNLRKEVDKWKSAAAENEKELNALRSITLWKFVRSKLSEWIRP